jgi:hypothetical protein
VVVVASEYHALDAWLMTLDVKEEGFACMMIDQLVNHHANQ